MPSGSQSAEDFAWFRAWVDQQLGLCLTFARGLTPDTMLTCLGADPTQAVDQTFEAATRDTKPRARAGTTGHWAYTVERFTSHGSDEATLASLSTGGEAFSLVYTLTTQQFWYARNGMVVFGFDMLLTDLRYGSEPHLLDQAVSQAGFGGPGTPDPPVMGARLVQRAFGVTLTPTMLEQRLPSVPIP